MAENNKIVVLCKGFSKNNDRQKAYVKTLESGGYSCECLQTLNFEFVNISKLQTCLSTPDKYTGLILTSPRTVEAIAMAIKGNINLNNWRQVQVPVYCIGPATESAVKSQLNFEHCIGSQSGNSEKLAERIVLDIKKNSKPLLYPCSEIARDTITHILNDKEILVEKIIVYKTLKNNSSEQNLLEILKMSPSIFVFFSPSTAEYIAALLEKHSYNLKDIKTVALGPVTRDALINLGFNVYATADKPEPAALLHAIITAEHGIVKN